MESSGTDAMKSFDRTPYAPYDPDVDLYVYSRINLGIGTIVPLEYSDWRVEAMSWKEACYLHTGLNPAFSYRTTGPDAIKLWSDICVNGMDPFPVGSLKHGIMCGEDGLILVHGVLMRLDEEDFVMHYRAPYAEYMLEKGDYDAKGEYIRDEFIFQMGGPRSLEVLENATGECLHDIRFGRHRPSQIDGHDVRILRMGMAGTLGYEVHGKTERVIDVYNAIMTAGEPYGIRKLGRIGYAMNHTENGFPQSFVDFPGALATDKGFMEWMDGKGPRRSPARLLGSLGPGVEKRYRTPVEVGWEKMIRFNHDFVGRKALEREVASPRRTMVTLIWNPEDILDIYRSQYEPGEHYLPMDDPISLTQKGGRSAHYADQTLADGKLVGISTGRMYSYYYREMMSLCSIDVEHSKLGAEVTVLWGDPGARQKEIRATVSRFPYMNENRNETVDVSEIPCQISKNEGK
ncbi:aminomethyltransferase family protein [Pseudofrankia sp. BMG5.36]|uniref:aminomethyltransferase family protein n=1 Tax=Pseudofrankia sp. BMG5.36 TaxID=1834512 RepID=UPI0008D953FE|nr:aminomethyltransferase family protein [Pseudofrankia sp. BMG5.36]OHV74330.1 aminomethyltransferase [Pseudofrankia sp. BMG5.36]